jgi:hypothetical protein
LQSTAHDVIIYDKVVGGSLVSWFDYLWLEGDEGNIEHIAEHGLTQHDVEFVMENFTEERKSRSSGRPIRFGFTPDGRYIAVIYEWMDDVTVYPVTAYEVED